ncbi:class I poly(R)-hydroxyalkanoic acid synthase [Lentilitoribacter sp. Alg239-R112]|uniref:PHA/PHB synthase family protein n=1 Tax=Lentilitoribacter sp. Alg239-R112 TaxID=2305987 RepID=UPI001FCF0DE1|nr:class I poly(R)-hydroxyalkanoic acid synthase [Lentilitoribacter sp. Alg239-R112]
MKKGAKDSKTEADASLDAYIVDDPQKMAVNFARTLENLGKAAAAWAERQDEKKQPENAMEPYGDMVETLSKVGQYWLEDPKRAIEVQTSLLTSYFDLWSNSVQKLSTGDDKNPLSERKDRRFADPDWQEKPFFELLRNTYWLTSDWAQKLVAQAEGLDDSTKHKAEFYVRQITEALSPSNFAMTNPEVYKETVATNGENLARGMEMFAQDIVAGKGELKIRQVDSTPFVLGENIAITPGKVIAQNDICQVIQYQAKTEQVIKRPLLICPPWINKFYILDLNEKKSFIKWLVEQGHTVFMISWVNPDERHAKYDWTDYSKMGVNFALDAIEKATGEKQVNAIGYCVGGTLLTATMALHAKTGDKRIKSATFFTTQVDFTHAGDLKIFAARESIETIEEDMKATGYLEGSKMAAAFNMLRAADLIWPYVVNNYLKGQQPMPFDLLHWNSDSTRMAAANHSFYLRNCYLENNLSTGKMVLDDKTIDPKDINIPVMHIAAKEDHIAPPESVYLGCNYFSGPTEFVMAGSGHIAGVINPPAQNKYQFWHADRGSMTFEEWKDAAKEEPGSWWPYWHSWIEKMCPDTVEARKIGNKKLKVIEDAPGSYVMAKV